jgi:hypothetical protein
MAHFGCPSCSKTVESGWKACPHCGASIEGAQKTPGRMTGGRLTFLLIVGAGLFFLAMVMVGLTAMMGRSNPAAAKATAAATSAPVAEVPTHGPKDHALDASLTFDGPALVIKNTGKERWILADLKLNPSGILQRGYSQNVGGLQPGKSIRLLGRNFVDGDGMRFNPSERAVTQSRLRIKVSDGCEKLITFR